MPNLNSSLIIECVIQPRAVLTFGLSVILAMQ